MESAAKEPTMFIVGRSVRGRPRAPEPGSSVSTWIPASYHDRLIQIANLHEMSVSAYVNKVLTREIDRTIE